MGKRWTVTRSADGRPESIDCDGAPIIELSSPSDLNVLNVSTVVRLLNAAMKEETVAARPATARKRGG